jgi:hypothetical protein
MYAITQVAFYNVRAKILYMDGRDNLNVFLMVSLIEINNSFAPRSIIFFIVAHPRLRFTDCICLSSPLISTERNPMI